MAEENFKQSLIDELNKRVEDKILEKTDAEFLTKLINKVDNDSEALKIAALGTTYKKTGLHFTPKLEETCDNKIRYFKKNEKLSFHTDDDENAPLHKLIIGDNYPALQNLLIQYKGKIDVIYIDPPYGKDKMGEFAKTNYNNAITRDNLLSMLYMRLKLAKQLLSDDGVIFCSIDDKNQAYVKCLFDDVFGEDSFLFCVARITKKGGKTTQTIAKNNDYIIAYTLSREIIFNQEDKNNLEKYKYSDKYENERGKYALTQTLDYNSLQYGNTMDYPLEFNGKTYYPGGDYEKYKSRKNGNHKQYDWTWRWSESAVKWGIENDLLELKGNRIYTKSYLKCRKKTGKNELEYIEATKAYTTLSFLDNEYSNDNGKKELDKIFDESSEIFKNPKPSSLIAELIRMISSNTNSIILDFFAGSGTSGHAVLDLNYHDGGKREFILCQINEITEENPNGIAYDVTTKRLKRIMAGECYDGTKNFKWIEKNTPYGGNLDVYEIAEISSYDTKDGISPFEEIDESLYGKEKFSTIKEKIDWVCQNFENTQRILKKTDKE